MMIKNKIFKTFTALALCLVLVFGFTGCGGGGDAKKLSVSPDTLELMVGESATLSVNTDITGEVSWSTSNADIATVSNGTVTAVGGGTASITAALGGKTAVCTVKVEGFSDFNAIVDGEVKFSYFEQLSALKTVDVVEYNFGTSKHSQQGEKIFGELVTLSVMQGLLAKTKDNTSGIYLNIKEGGMSDSASSTWLDVMKEMDSEVVSSPVTATNDKTAFALMLEKYKDKVKMTANNKPGFVLFKQKITDAIDGDNNPIQVGQQNVNAACTVSAATGYLAVDETSRALAESLGYEMAVDATGMNEIDAYNAYKDQLSDDIIMLSNNGQAQNRDLGVALGTFFMYESNKSDTFMNGITHPTSGKYEQGTLAIGWSSTGEVSQVNRHALYGFNFTCTNYSYNLSQTARFGQKSFKQKNKGTAIKADATKKYVTLIMTDGDNITWHQNDFPFSNGWYGYDNRGDFKMGWTMAPIMADIAPGIIKREYEMATPQDSFVCGVSGSGYVYPSEYGLNTEALTKLAQTTDEYMRRADLDYVEILDNRPFDTAVMKEYAKQPNIDGGFVLANYDLYKQGGDIKYYNGKPFMGIGEAMWSDTPGRIAHRLNSLPVDTTSSNGYTAVKIHCWSTSMSDVARMVSLLDENIVIVSPGEMMQLVKDNVKADSARTAKPDTKYPADVDEYVDAKYFYESLTVNSKSEFNFDTFKEYEGWSKFIGSKQYDYVSFSGEAWKYSTSIPASVSGDGFSIRMDGSDYGNADSTPNSAIYSKIKVPDSSKARFSFFVRGEAYGFDADYRVRVITNASGKPAIESLCGWTEAGDNFWREVSFDVSKYKGEEVVLLIEHNSTQREGDGEILYIDNIKIGEETLDIAEIKKGTINTNTIFDFTAGVQGFKWTTSNGGAVGHNSAKGTLDVTTGAVVAAGEKADAALYTRFDLASIGDKFSNRKFGIWANTNSGTAEIRMAVVSADGKQILRSGMYQSIGVTPKYISVDYDTFRIKGGAFKYAYLIIEVRGTGAKTVVSLDNGNYSSMVRDIENGYFYDAEYLASISAKTTAELSQLTAWGLEGGRGMEDEAVLKDGVIRMYGYDFMKGNDSSTISKALGNRAKVKNEFNARIYARTTIDTASDMVLNLTRIEKTLQNQAAVNPQVRVLFIEDDGTVTVLKAYSLIENTAAFDMTVSLSSVNGKTGVLLVECDSAGNGDRAGVNVNSVMFN